MKLIRIWMPDPNSPEFKKEAKRQTRAVANSAVTSDAAHRLNRALMVFLGLAG